MALNVDVVESVTNTNFKVIADQPALQTNHARDLANLALANAVSFQQSMNQVSLGATAKMVELLATIDVAEAAGLTPVAQQAAKVAQSTPPETAVPK